MIGPEQIAQEINKICAPYSEERGGSGYYPIGQVSAVIGQHLDAARLDAARKMQERCAQVADAYTCSDANRAAERIAAAIRALNDYEIT